MTFQVAYYKKISEKEERLDECGRMTSQQERNKN